MLHSNIDPLLDVSVAHALVDDYANSALGDIVDDSGFAVIDFVWHTVERQPLGPMRLPHSGFREIAASFGVLGV